MKIQVSIDRLVFDGVSEQQAYAKGCALAEEIGQQIAAGQDLRSVHVERVVVQPRYSNSLWGWQAEIADNVVNNVHSEIGR